MPSAGLKDRRGCNPRTAPQGKVNMANEEKCVLTFGDTETSGIAGSVEEAIKLDRQIIEYAFVVWSNGDRIRRIERKVMPTGGAIADAEECAANGWNHFKRDDWWTPVGPQEYTPAKPWSEADCENVDDFLTDATFAGSNPAFDLHMFQATFHVFGVGHLFPKLATHRMCDVGALAWPLWTVGLTDKTGLAPLAKLLGVEHRAHTAMGDVEACIDCFEILVESFVFRPRQQAELLRELGRDCKVLPVVEAELAKLRGIAL